MTSADENRTLAYALARVGLGVNIALHGLVRLPKLDSFAKGLQEQFASSILPSFLVQVSAYGIVFAEAVLGVLILLGWFLRPALVLGALLMIFLITGTCLIENWSAAGIQMTYLGFYAVLLATANYDGFSVDQLRHGGRQRRR
ncbi:MAG TPA: DoxX family protein [Verrucomicrobium sp.]|nr:DoxX family protein [Verrucomicrobium sp.]